MSGGLAAAVPVVSRNDGHDLQIMTDTNPEEFRELVQKFKDLISPALQTHETERELEEARSRVDAGLDASYRHLLNLDDVRKFEQRLAHRLIREPLLCLRTAEDALKEKCTEFFGASALEGIRLLVGVIGEFGSALLSPRGLKASVLGTLVCVEGIITKVSVCRPKLVKSRSYCPNTGRFSEQEFRDATDLSGLPTPTAMTSKDRDNNPLEMELGLSEYRNNQRVTIQEMPERAPLGQLPRSVDVVLENDLVDKVKPGDRVRCCGIYRALASSLINGASRGETSVGGMFRTLVIGNAIHITGNEVGGMVITEKDIVNIRRVSEEGEDVFDRLARSLAPSIYGHAQIKRAVLLFLLGGVERNLANGAHLRGDINILLVGDPSTAKSQVLRFVLGIAPLAISTTGRGSTGVGLTAAVTTDQDTGERRLEAGAMVLADRGVVLIDEFDKMSDGDRVAIHEVMEQQTVTIAKAGIHASLNARCSVLAAANPVYGAYDRSLTPQRNVALPDSLLSRFDLLFIVLDSSTPQHDRAISDHVLRLHRYVKPGKEGVPVVDAEAGMEDDRRRADDGRNKSGTNENGEAADATSIVYQKFNPLLHGGFAEEVQRAHKRRRELRALEAGRDVFGAAEEEEEEDEVDEEVFADTLFSTDFLKKYIQYAKQRIKPVLTAEASRLIGIAYSELRQEMATKRTLPITPRCLETLIRLSTAHAKARLSPHVEEKDCHAARAALRFALYSETEDEADTAERERVRQQAMLKKLQAARDAERREEEREAAEAAQKRPRLAEETEAPVYADAASPARKQFFQEVIAPLTRSDETSFQPEFLRKQVNDQLLRAHAKGERAAWPSYSREEVDTILRAMELDNNLMIRDDNIFFF